MRYKLSKIPRTPITMQGSLVDTCAQCGRYSCCLRLQKQCGCLLWGASCARFRHEDVSNPTKGLRPLWQAELATPDMNNV